MRKILLPWTAGIAAVISLVSSSCTYDPYYSSSGSYYSGGYGYGSGSVSTSLFVSTGDPHWGYDPHSYCYYDYRSRRYYDPYLYGYYPVGYRPYAVYGVPHPYGWRQGHGHCPPPRTVRNVTVVNYRDRESAYRNSNYSWARQVRHRESGDSHRYQDYRKPDYRTDYRTRDNDRDSSNQRSWSPRETIRTREYTPDPRESRDRHQRDDYRSTERSSPREFRPESTRHQSMPRPQSSHQFDRRQFEHPKENRSRDNNDSRGKSSDSHEKNSERKSLRSLGDG